MIAINRKLSTDVEIKIESDYLINPILHDGAKSLWKKESYQVKNFFKEDEIQWLVNFMFRMHNNRRIKECGTLHFMNDFEPIQEKIGPKLKELEPDLLLEHWEGNFVLTATPYNLHIDTGRPDFYKRINKYRPMYVPHKQFVIPLFVCHTNPEFKGTDKVPLAGTAIFKNRFLRYGTNFAKSSKTYGTDVFHTVTNYEDLTSYNIDGSVANVDWSKPFDEDLRKKYIDHFPKQWLDGFELENVFQADVGSVIVWDRAQAHSGTHFIKQGVTLKSMLVLQTVKAI
tara:strand:- start:5183 stop:6034 length:852 start_codon:yes stop_codon:yes gene_type:complete